MTARGVTWLRTGVVPVILCLWLATPCTRAQGPNEPAAAGKPLSKSEIIYMLGGQVTRTRVATLARERGIDFELTPEVETELRKFGAADYRLAVAQNKQSDTGQTAGTVRENPKDGLKYVWIPPGTFQMGCSPGDNECEAEERPTHQVTITKGFWMGQTEVTVGAYKRFAAATRQKMPPAPDFNRGWANDNMPIVNVTWNDAHDYCAWAGERLPTEAEWEYAARGGSTEARYGPPDEVGWYEQNSAHRTHEVGQKHANGFGLFDVLGNVWEWVNDWYDENYYQISPSQDPPGPASGPQRVLRGGSWVVGPGGLRVSVRDGDDPAVAFGAGDYAGLRCAGELVNPLTKVQAGLPEIGPAAGTIRENPKDGLKYVWISPGTFQMGCSPGDSECVETEMPSHQVTLTRGFWMGQTEVTAGAYKRFAAATGRQMPGAPLLDSGWVIGSMPIVNLSWDDAHDYCTWAGGRLPTEAEWEYAARGGSTEARYGPLDEVAWYADNSGRQRLDSVRVFIENRKNYGQRLKDNGDWMHEVGQKRANGFGLLDVLGNVWEWVNDWYDENYYQNSASQDPPGPPSGSVHVVRGGSWFDAPGLVRVSLRLRGYPFNWVVDGFRCAAEVINP